jgi:TonB family protein
VTLANTKKIVLALGAVALFGVLVCGGGGVFVYLKYFRTPSIPDVGPMAGQALQLPAETAVIAGFDAKGLFASTAYKQIAAGEVPTLAPNASPEEAARSKNEVKEGLEKGLKAVEEKIGIRLDRDLDRLVIAGTNVSAPTPDGALLAIGRFDRAKVMKAVEASTKSEGAVMTSKTVEGVDVRVFTEAGKPGMEAAFLDDSVLVVGTAGGVEAVVANHAKRVRPLEGNTELMTLVKGLDPASSYWVVLGQTLVTQAQKQAGGAAPPVPLPHSLTLSGKFEGGLELAAEMADEAAAKNIVEMAEQGLSLVRMQAAQSPEVGKVPGAKEMLEGIKVTAEAKVVKLRVPGGGGGNAAMGGALAGLAMPMLRSRIAGSEAAGPASNEAAPPSLSPANPPPPAPLPSSAPTPRPRVAPRAATPTHPPATEPAARPTVTTPPEPPAPPQPLRVGGEIREPRRLKDVKPTYPPIAQQARVQGIVILEATIGAQGNVTDVRVLRSIPMLDQAALDAVKQWVYAPTLVNGVPVPVIMTVTVKFTLK